MKIVCKSSAVQPISQHSALGNFLTERRNWTDPTDGRVQFSLVTSLCTRALRMMLNDVSNYYYRFCFPVRYTYFTASEMRLT